MIEIGITINNRLTSKIKGWWETEVAPDTEHEAFLIYGRTLFLDVTRFGEKFERI